VPEERRIFTELTVLENLEVGKQEERPGAPSWDADKLMRLFPNLPELAHRRGGQMSGGEQQMLTVARTLMGNPRLVMLDEPPRASPRVLSKTWRTRSLRSSSRG
jgi:branched-chain amino acid transport system ATP-binding protein